MGGVISMAGSLASPGFGAIILLGLAVGYADCSTFVYATGLSALWMLLGIWGGYIVAWVVLGKQLQQRAHQHKYVILVNLKGICHRPVSMRDLCQAHCSGCPAL